VWYKDVLEIVANWAAILTAAVATIAYGRFWWAQWVRRKALENYLREEKLRGHDQGRRSVIHLMADLAMTESQVLEAAFQSKRIASVSGTDDQGRAARLLFEYEAKDLPEPRKF
jgi:hypothetical protein